MHLLPSEKNHGSLIDIYDELMIERAVGKGDPPTVYAETSIYDNSFLP